jgi:hypothetical protein
MGRELGHLHVTNRNLKSKTPAIISRFVEFTLNIIILTCHFCHRLEHWVGKHKYLWFQACFREGKYPILIVYGQGTHTISRTRKNCLLSITVDKLHAVSTLVAYCILVDVFGLGTSVPLGPTGK